MRTFTELDASAVYRDRQWADTAYQVAARGSVHPRPSPTVSEVQLEADPLSRSLELELNLVATRRRRLIHAHVHADVRIRIWFTARPRSLNAVSMERRLALALLSLLWTSFYYAVQAVEFKLRQIIIYAPLLLLLIIIIIIIIIIIVVLLLLLLSNNELIKYYLFYNDSIWSLFSHLMRMIYFTHKKSKTNTGKDTKLYTFLLKF